MLNGLLISYVNIYYLIIEMEIREFGRSSWNDTHNVTSLIIFLKYVSDILQTEEAFTVGEYKHTHTHTHTLET